MPGVASSVFSGRQLFDGTTSPTFIGLREFGALKRRSEMTDLRERLTQSLAERYSVEEEIGQGGMATVFVAEDRKHARKVAIKVLHPELGAALGAERFLREIEIAARLQHPHIVPLYDSGEAEGLLYYLMPFVEGESLRRRVARDGTLSLDEALTIVAEVADALDYAHRAGVVHRDIKPDNIMLSGSHALVADFGIATAVSSAGGEGLTQTGMAIGTPAYMSPEQVDGSRELDGRTDLYSLGCVLYEILGGRPPYDGPTALAILAQQARGEYLRLGELRPDVPPGVEDVIATALSPDPDQRFATAMELAHALQEAPTAAPTPKAAELERSIAVMPFQNIGGDPEYEYFSDGMSEEITTALAALPGLRVAARTSVLAYRGESTDPRTVGVQLNVTTLLEGSVRHAGDRVRVTAQLINVETGYQLWSQKFDRTLDDVFAIQDEIAAAIVGELSVTLTGSEERSIVDRGTENVVAHDLYWRGRHAWNSRRLTEALEFFQGAIGHDPNYAAPYAGIADSFSYLSLFGVYSTFDGATKARSAAERAVSLAPDLAEAHFSLGIVKLLYWELFESGPEFRRAIDLDPGHGPAHAYLACYHAAVREADEAKDQARRATQVEPLSSLVHALAGLALFWAGDPLAAAASCERALEIDPTSIPGRYNLGLALSALGRHDEAVATLEATAELMPVPMILSYLGGAYAMAGRTGEAAAVLEQLVERAKTDVVPALFIAYVLSALGDLEEAMIWVVKGFDQRNSFVWGAHLWPATAPLLSDPRYKAQLETVGLGALAAERG